MDKFINFKQDKWIRIRQPLIGRALISLINFYQKYLSPFLGKSCRFYPTCSQYYTLAIQKYGSAKGTILFLRRILRCNPFSKGGVDFP